MTDKEVIRKILWMRDWNHADLAEAAGLGGATNVSGFLNNTKKGTRIDNLVKLLDAMGCEVVVRDKMGSKQEWVIDMVEEKKYPMPPKGER